jgi:hypothetical protein
MLFFRLFKVSLHHQVLVEDLSCSTVLQCFSYVMYRHITHALWAEASTSLVNPGIDATRQSMETWSSKLWWLASLVISHGARAPRRWECVDRESQSDH